MAFQELTALGSLKTVPLGMDTGIHDGQQQKQGTSWEFSFRAGGGGAEETDGERTVWQPHAWSLQAHGDTAQSPPAIKRQGALEIGLSIVVFRDLDVTSLYS